MKHQLPKIWKKVIISDLATVPAYSCSEMSEITKPQATEQSASRDPNYKRPNTSFHHTVLRYLRVLLVKIISSKYTAPIQTATQSTVWVCSLSLACWVYMSLL